MGLDALNKLLSRKDQKFICYPAGTQQDRHSKFEALITHEVSGPLDNTQLNDLEQKIGFHDQLFDLLSVYGSVRLYCDTLSESSAYYLVHPSEWDELNSDFNAWLDSLDEKERNELLPEWLDDAIVIGEVPSSGNYFLFPTQGSEKGKVFEFDHDGFEFLEKGKDLNSFMDKICSITEELLSDIRSHTRYSDGKTDTQWLVQEYVSS